MEWISVKDKLPQYFVDVIAFCQNEDGLTFGNGEKYCSIDCFIKWKDGHEDCFRTDRFYGKVTHWMPLPKPPEENIG